MSSFTIGQLAERTGLTTSALRYYERCGLLDPTERSGAGYRLYDETSEDRLRFIRRAKALGCTLEEIVDLLALLDQDECRPVQARLHELVTAKLAAANRQGDELVELTAQLRQAGRLLGEAALDGPCHDGCACHGGDDGGPPMAEPAGGPQPITFGRVEEQAIVCTLDSAALQDRIADWRRLLSHAVDRQPDADGDGLRITFGPEVPHGELMRLTTAEQGCCTFFAFAITVDQRGLAMEVRAPEEAADLVAMVFGAVPNQTGS